MPLTHKLFYSIGAKKFAYPRTSGCAKIKKILVIIEEKAH